MLQSMGWNRLRHDQVTEQQQEQLSIEEQFSGFLPILHEIEMPSPA